MNRFHHFMIKENYRMMRIMDRNHQIRKGMNNMSDVHIYDVCGYDKDADVYELFAVSTKPEMALKVGRALIHYHMNVKELRREETKEPFDWFEVLEKKKRVKVFTTEYPDGIKPEKLEQEG